MTRNSCKDDILAAALCILILFACTPLRFCLCQTWVHLCCRVWSWWTRLRRARAWASSPWRMFSPARISRNGPSRCHEAVFLNVYGAQESIQGMNSASLWSLAGRYDNHIPTRFLSPIDCLKIPALSSIEERGGIRVPNDTVFVLWAKKNELSCYSFFSFFFFWRMNSTGIKNFYRKKKRSCLLWRLRFFVKYQKSIYQVCFINKFLQLIYYQSWNYVIVESQK